MDDVKYNGITVHQKNITVFGATHIIWCYVLAGYLFMWSSREHEKQRFRQITNKLFLNFLVSIYN